MLTIQNLPVSCAQNNMDKLRVLNEGGVGRKILGAVGEIGDVHQFCDYVERNLYLYNLVRCAVAGAALRGVSFARSLCCRPRLCLRADPPPIVCAEKRVRAEHARHV
jgi:hypothetical protein